MEGRGEMRCGRKILHGIVVGDRIEVKCKSNQCGHAPGVIVLHYFDSHTGDLLETKKLREPSVLFEQRRK